MEATLHGNKSFVQKKKKKNQIDNGFKKKTCPKTEIMTSHKLKHGNFRQIPFCFHLSSSQNDSISKTHQCSEKGLKYSSHIEA